MIKNTEIKIEKQDSDAATEPCIVSYNNLLSILIENYQELQINNKNDKNESRT